MKAFLPASFLALLVAVGLVPGAFADSQSGGVNTGLLRTANPWVAPQSFLGPVILDVCPLTDGSTITSSAVACANDSTKSIGTNAVTLTAAGHTLVKPAGLVSGIDIMFIITHSGNDGPLLKPSDFLLPGRVQPPACNPSATPPITSSCWSITAGATDWLPCRSVSVSGTVYLGCAGVLTNMGIMQSSQTWSSAHISANITLSSANLVATQTAQPGVNSSVYAANAFSSGKVYWDVTPTFTGSAGAEVIGIGLSTAATTDNAFIGNTGGDGIGLLGSGQVWYNGSAIATIAPFTTSTPVCIAVDYPNGKVWFQPSGTNQWNNAAVGSQNPASNLGGISISSLTSSGTLAIAPGASTKTTNDVMTANFTTPCGYVSGATLVGFTTFP